MAQHSIEEYFNRVFTVNIMKDKTFFIPFLGYQKSMDQTFLEIVKGEWSLIQVDSDVSYFFFKISLLTPIDSSNCIHAFMRRGCRMETSSEKIKTIHSRYECLLCGLKIATQSSYKVPSMPAWFSSIFGALKSPFKVSSPKSGGKKTKNGD